MLDLWNEVGPSTHEAIGARVLPSVQHAPRTFVPSVPRKGEDMRLRGRRVGPNNDLVGAADEATLYRLIHELESRKDFVIHFEAELKLDIFWSRHQTIFGPRSKTAQNDQQTQNLMVLP